MFPLFIFLIYIRDSQECNQLHHKIMYWNSDDIILSILGGILLSFACTINYMLRGRITGYSGIYYEVITFNQDTLYWKLSYLSSIVIATTIMYKIYGYNII